MSGTVASRHKRNAPLFGADPVAVVERGYRLDLSDREWLEELSRSLRPILDRGYGVTAYAYDLAKSVDEWFESAVAVNAPPDEIEFARWLVGAMRPGDATTIHVAPSLLEGAAHAFRQLGQDIRTE